VNNIFDDFIPETDISALEFKYCAKEPMKGNRVNGRCKLIRR
jgi:hypothetical protein